MKTKISKFSKYLLILALCFTFPSSFTYGQDTLISDFEDIEPSILTNDFEDISLNEEEIEDEPEISFDDYLIKLRLDDHLKYAKTSVRQIKNNMLDTEYHLSNIVQTRIDLETQLKILDDAITRTEERLELLNNETIKTKSEILVINDKIEIGEVAFEYKKKLLTKYVEVFYKEHNRLFPIDADLETITLRFLASDNSVGENLRLLHSLSTINQSAYQILDVLEEISFELEVEKRLLNDVKEKLDILKAEIEDEKKNLNEQIEAKRSFLVSTKGQEQIFSQLLEQSNLEQKEALENVRLLDFAIREINNDIEKYGSFDSSKYEKLISSNYANITEFRRNYSHISGDINFDWPVEPFRGLSAYFRDSGYASFFGVRHNAIDIPVFQGTPVRSVADGVVYKTVDNGYGYSYIIVAHTDGFSSVYGHISNILVEAGEIVSMGSIIGLSGGMPGTKGAGYMTTGPHLHFELLKDGDYVDPLFYLPLYILTSEQIEWLPDVYKEIWRKSVLDVSGGRISRFEIQNEEEVLDNVLIER